MPVAVKAIIPKKSFVDNRYKGLVKDLTRYMTGPGPSKIKNEMNKTTQGWTQRPTFSYKFKPYEREGNQTGMSVVVFPTGRGTLNWVRISRGTGPRTIHAKGKPMVFQPGYSPRTTPSGQWGQAKVRSGPWIKTYTVHRHRIEPREFSKHIIAAKSQEWQRDLDNIIRRNLK